jgi:uncharacterized membrane protein YcfT
MSVNKNRLDWVDASKGLSIILVVMMHSAYGVGDDLNNVGVLHYIIGWALPFRMPEFFLISGLFLGQVINRPFRLYADRRVVHYLYFYALWVVLQVVSKVGLGTGDVGSVFGQIAWAVVEPYGVLWFIYMLAVYSLVTKLFHMVKVPHWAALVLGGGLMMAQAGGLIVTGFGLIDHFCMYFVYFYTGYACAPLVFRIVESAQRNWLYAVFVLLAFGVIQWFLVFEGGVHLYPRGIDMGYASFPPLHLVLGLVGSVMVCIAGGLVAKLPWMNWLRWLGEHSIVVYLSFSIPMAASRTLILKTGVLTDTSTVSVIVMAIALLSPLVLYWLIQKTGWGKFLFERPAWAHIPGTPGSRGYIAPERKAHAVPAE